MKIPHLFRTFHGIEVLESRIAPAAVTLSFFDKDSQAVSVTSSKGTIAELQTAVGVAPGATAAGVLSFQFGAVFKGADITVTAGANATDLITTQVGFVNAAGVDLGKLTIDGELDRINAGDSNSASAALKSITVGQWGNGTAPTAVDQFDSVVIGAIGTLTVRGDFTAGYLVVRGSDSFDPPPSAHLTDVHGKIGTLFIGGSLVGTARDNGGHIFATGDITKLTVVGSVKGFEAGGATLLAPVSQDFNARIFSGGKISTLLVGTDAAEGNVQGGDGDFSGQIVGVVGVGSVTVKGSIEGGSGLESGAIGAAGDLGAVVVTKNLVGGGGTRSGTLLSFSSIQKVNIGGNIEGGSGFNSGAIGCLLNIGNVVVTGDIIGGSGTSSGQIVAQGAIKNVTVRNLIGGSQFESGAIGSLKGLGAILVKGDIVAGEGTRSGFISTEVEPFDRIIEDGGGDIPDPSEANAPIASVTVLGSIIGIPDQSESYAGYRAGGILSSGKLGPVVVSGDLIGGDNFETGRIASSSSIASVKIAGSIEGGDGTDSGTISSEENIASVSVGGEVRGGNGDGSGSIQTTGNLGAVSIGTTGGELGDSLIGGSGERSGAVISGGKLAKIDIFGNVLGGNGPGSGSIETQGEGSLGDMGPVFIAKSLIGSFGSASAVDSGQIFSSGKLASVVIGDPKDTDTESGGSVIGGIALGSGAISSELDMGPVKIKRNLQGGTGNESGKITSGGKLTSLTVGSESSPGSIFGGDGNYDTTVESGNQFGQVFAEGAIGPVVVFGNVSGNTGSSAGGAYSGQIRGLSIASVTIHGNLNGGRGASSGGFVATSLNIGPVVIAGNVEGGEGSASGFISAAGNLTSVKLGASLLGGEGSGSGYIAAGVTLGTFEAAFASGGSESSRPRISAGKTISSVTIFESIANTDILAGYTTSGFEFNPDAQIGTVKIGTGTGPGQMQGTNIVAGLSAGMDGRFGTFDDHSILGTDNPAIYSKIASVVVKGSVTNTSSSSDRFGIIAQHLVALKVGSSTLPLTAGPLNDDYTGIADSSDTVYGERLID